ncbi:hypothetical protein LBMAG42_44270 [Deltaproteobacteria bacterium]|nr:hypothetical protein LBMAG42_44270 [Deltaproteobacteria bacterium]
MSGPRGAAYALVALGTLTGCAPAEDASSIVATSTLAELVPTVVIVEWETPEPSRGHVEFSVVGEERRATPAEAEATRTHSRTLLGLPVGVDVEFTIFDEEGALGAAQTLATGAMPTDWAALTVVGEASWEGFVVLGVAGAMADLVVLDNRGRPVWWWTDVSADDQVIRALPAADRSGMLASFGGTRVGESATIALSDWQAGTQGSVEVPEFTHDFLERGDGGFAALTFAFHDDETGAECISDAVTEFDFGGAYEPIWDTWDAYAGLTQPCDAYIEGWSHANALDWDEASQTYTVGMRNLATLSVVDRAARAELWSLGEYGSVALADPKKGFIGQHQFERLPDGNVLVFDNGASNTKISRVVELSADTESGVAEIVWSYAPAPAVYVYALGDVKRLPNGNTLVDWSTSGRLEEVTPEGETAWQLDAALGAEFGYMHVFDSFYPASPAG